MLPGHFSLLLVLRIRCRNSRDANGAAPRSNDCRHFHSDAHGTISTRTLGICAVLHPLPVTTTFSKPSPASGETNTSTTTVVPSALAMGPPRTETAAPAPTNATSTAPLKFAPEMVNV